MTATDALRDRIAQAIESVTHDPGGGRPCELCVETADAVVEALADPTDLGYELVCLVPEPDGHGNCRTKPCRSMRCPAEIDRLPLEELRRFAHRQRQLIEAFRRQHNYHLDYIQDLEQQIKTMERQLRLVAHIAEIDSGALEDQVRDIEEKLAEGWVPPARSAAEIVDELRREEANRG